MMTGEQYIESIRRMKMHIFCLGEELETAVGHPMLQPALNSVKMTYDLAQDAEYKKLMTVVSTEVQKYIRQVSAIHMRYLLCLPLPLERKIGIMPYLLPSRPIPKVSP